MLYKFIKKFRKVICLFLVLCISVPLLSACGQNENFLKKSKDNKIIGLGGNIQAYTTYSQARFTPMDKDMYLSYLVSGRDFILVVVPEGTGNSAGHPNPNNLMFQAVYNGVSPYSKELVDGNFVLSNPEYKLLIYYVLADEFLEWDKKANSEEERGFISKALDFMGPSDADNYSINIDLHNKHIIEVNANIVENEEDYNLRNIVNMNQTLSECDFLKVDDYYNIVDYKKENLSMALEKCGDSNKDSKPDGKNVIADVAKGRSAGVTLLYSGGGMTGYFTSEQVEQYNFENVGWINNLLSQYGDTNDEQRMSYYLQDVLNDTICYGSNANSEICSGNYAKQMTYKLKYDLSLLGRISKINYNTILDYNKGTSVTSDVTKISDANEYASILKGATSYNGGDYIAYTTSEGFIHDRGNIVMGAAEDFVFNTNFLEVMTQMDACTNRTFGSYVAEVLANVGIMYGVGFAFGGAALAVAGSVSGALATAGVISAGIPVVGWIVGSVALLAAGAIALYVGISTKKSINDANSANFCDVYDEAVKEIIDKSSIKIPVLNYHIPKDRNGYKTVICYEDLVEINGKEECGTVKEDGTFKKAASIPAFVMADVQTVDTLSVLSGSPSIRLYSDGKFIDEIYGATSPQFLYSIMDSWGVTAASSMRYYVTSTPTSISVYDLLSGTDRNTKITSAQYCLSLEYEKACTNGTSLSLNYNSFSNGVYRKSINVTQQKNKIIEDLTRNVNKISKEDVTVYKNQLSSVVNSEVVDESKIDAILNDLNGLFNNKAGNAITTFKGNLIPKLASKEEALDIVNNLDVYLSGIIYYSISTPVYITVTIDEYDNDSSETYRTATSSRYEMLDVELRYEGV